MLPQAKLQPISTYGFVAIYNINIDQCRMIMNFSAPVGRAAICDLSLSLSLSMFSHLVFSKLCCVNITLHAADLVPNCAKHWLFTRKCHLSVSCPVVFYSLIRNLFLSAQNIVFSQVSATFVLPVPFFLFPNSQLIPNSKKHCVFTGKCCMRLASHFFYSLIRNLFQDAHNIVFSQVNAACLFRPIFLFRNSRLIRLTWPC